MRNEKNNTTPFRFRGVAAGGGGPAVRGTGAHAGEVPQRAFRRHAPPRGHRPRRGQPSRRWCSTTRPPRGWIPSPPTPSSRSIIKERDLRNTTTVIVTHRYQDGTWLDDFRYNPRSGRLEPARQQRRAGGIRDTVHGHAGRAAGLRGKPHRAGGFPGSLSWRSS